MLGTQLDGKKNKQTSRRWSDQRLLIDSETWVILVTEDPGSLVHVETVWISAQPVDYVQAMLVCGLEFM